MDPGPSAPQIDEATERNTVLLENSDNPDVNSENRQTCREYGIHAGKDELRRLQKFVSQAIIKLLNRYNLTQKNGKPYVSSCPKGFLQGPDVWLGEKGYQISGWPRGLPCGSISIWPTAYIFALAVMFINGTIDLKPTGRGVTGTSEGSSGPARRRRRRRCKSDITANGGPSSPQARRTLVDSHYKSSEYVADSDEADSESEFRRSLVSTRTSVLSSSVTRADVPHNKKDVGLDDGEGSDNDAYESDSDVESSGDSVVGTLSSPKHKALQQDEIYCLSRMSEANSCPGKRDEQFEELPFSQESPTSQEALTPSLGKGNGGAKAKSRQETEVHSAHINSTSAHYSNPPHNLNTPDDNERLKSSSHFSSSSSEVSFDSDSDVKMKDTDDISVTQKQTFKTNLSYSESSEASSIENSDSEKPVIRLNVANQSAQSSSASDESDSPQDEVLQAEKRHHSLSSSSEKNTTSEDESTRSSSISDHTTRSASPLKDRKGVAKANLSDETSSETSESSSDSSDSSDSDGGVDSNASAGIKSAVSSLTSVTKAGNRNASTNPSSPSMSFSKAQSPNATRARYSLFPLPGDLDLSTSQSIESLVSSFTRNSSQARKTSESKKRKAEIELEYPGVPTGATINWLPPTSATRTEVKKKRSG